VPSAAHTITEEIDDDEIARRLAALVAGENPDAGHLEADVYNDTGWTAAPLGKQVDDYRFFTPFEEAASEYVAWSRSPGTRIYTGIDEFDSVMRGVAPKELCLIVGYAHSG
jgi:hypothetical protein